ncbi:MAG: twin-arginine translocase TatA/TatE family subunit [Candidatus Eremiobacteraeota bacterium]|nr:twin-arginine translocase TatA/TatE family subunit [Candidatus Eremiobacteraeota bacterium]
MLSVPDMALLGAAALLLFGPEQLPKVMRKVGQFTREVQNTSQAFIREMERAAEVDEPVKTTSSELGYLDQPIPDEFVAPDGAAPSSVADTPPQPRPAHEVEEPQLPLGPLEPAASQPAEPAPQSDHSAHV